MLKIKTARIQADAIGSRLAIESGNKGGRNGKENDQGGAEKTSRDRSFGSQRADETDGIPWVGGQCGQRCHQGMAHWPDYLRALVVPLGRAFLTNTMCDNVSWEVWLMFVCEDEVLTVDSVVASGDTSIWTYRDKRRGKPRKYKSARSILWRVHGGARHIRHMWRGDEMKVIAVEQSGTMIITRFAK